jgi:hypothetical protein
MLSTMVIIYVIIGIAYGLYVFSAACAVYDVSYFVYAFTDYYPVCVVPEISTHTINTSANNKNNFNMLHSERTFIYASSLRLIAGALWIIALPTEILTTAVIRVADVCTHGRMYIRCICRLHFDPINRIFSDHRIQYICRCSGSSNRKTKVKQ